MNITVYCGSNAGKDPAFSEMAVRLGEWIAEGGHTLVYGGGNIGLMGILADTVLEHGGSVIGVIPEFLLQHESGHEGDHQLEVVPNMSVRKNRMIELGELYLAMPGGPGTLEEISEVISLHKLRRHNKPCVFYNINGYYEKMREVYQLMVDQGFYPQEELDKIGFISDPSELDALLQQIRIVYEGEKNRSAAYDGSRLIGECDYTIDKGRWIITHTEVDPEYGGRGIAGKLVDEIVEAARIEAVQIIPVCSYAVKKLTGKPEYEDVLKER